MNSPVQTDTADAADASPKADHDQRLSDLGEIIRSYNVVTENLQKSHDLLSREVVRLRKELASADAQLQRSKRLAALGEMAAGIAHEIRNPLGGIQLYADFLVEDLTAVAAGEVDQQTAQEMVEHSRDTSRKIQTAVQGLDAIVHDVLAFSRELRPRRTLLPVCLLFRRAVEAVEPEIKAAGVTIEIGDAAEDMLVTVDMDLMQQALLNLVRNAVAAMEHSPSRTLRLNACERDGSVVLCVADTGAGIDSEAIDRIFNPFFTTRNTGTGLGLAIVHRIVDAHSGAIAVRNKSQASDGESGAVFELSLQGETMHDDHDKPVAAARGGTDDTAARRHSRPVARATATASSR